MRAGGQARQIDRQAQDGLPPLDRDHLDSLLAHIGPAATRDLLAEGRVELAERLRRLARPGTPAEIGGLAHQIAGLAGSLGLPLVAHHARRVASAVRAGDDGPTADALAALRDAGAPALRALDAWSAAAGGAPGLRD